MTEQLTPIVVFAYNRPNHLSRTLARLAEADGARLSPVWLFCDGPKPGQSGADQEAVRRVAQDPRWEELFASVTLRFAEANKGLASSIIGGVSEVLGTSDRVIVLEDDLLVSNDFIMYMNAGLQYYEAIEDVGSLTGFCPLRKIPPGYSYDVMAVPRNSSQGWGTWADRWRSIDWGSKFAAQVWTDASLRRRMNIAGEDRVARLQRQFRGEIDSWSIRFGAWQVATGRVTIYPCKNRIENIGYDGTGVHSGAGTPKNDQIPHDLTLPRFVQPFEDPSVLKAFRRAYSGPLHRKLMRRLRLALDNQLR